MRRGNELEKHVNKLIKYVNDIGYHAHKNNPSRTVDGTYLEGEPFDYEIFLPKATLIFDAKECHDKNCIWHIKDKDIKQANNMYNCKKTGAEAFFLIYAYEIKKLIKVDVDNVIQTLKNDGKQINTKKYKEFDISGYL